METLAQEYCTPHDPGNRNQVGSKVRVRCPYPLEQVEIEQIGHTPIQQS